MDSILICADPLQADMADVVAHLERHDQLYFSIRFSIDVTKLTFPIAGFVHISGDRVRYVTQIDEIVPFSKVHFESPGFGDSLKPQVWLKDGKAMSMTLRMIPGSIRLS